MVTTVTDNSPQSINTSLFSLDKQVQEIKKLTDVFNDKISGINPKANVISVNGKQGIVTINAQDVHALPDTTVIPTTTGELTNDSGFITIEDVGASYVPLTRKVNNKELDADITLTASDVGALPDSTVVPTKTSQLTNDSDFATNSALNSVTAVGLKETYHFTRTNIAPQTWTDIIKPSDIPQSGIYVFNLSFYDNVFWWSENATFLTYFFATGTNSGNSTPIYFNQEGHAPNNQTIQLRFQRVFGNTLQQSIQIYFSNCNQSTISLEVFAYRIA